MSKADDLFIMMCRSVLNEGSSSEGQRVRARWEDGSPAHTMKQFGIINRYDLAEEFPLLTLRPTNLAAAVDELLWIWQKKSNNIRDLSSHIWDSWADESGSIGKAYGYQLGLRHTYPEGEFDQVDRVLHDLAHAPWSRRMVVNMYNHADLHEMHLYPCAHSVTFNVVGKKLNAILNQRSQDVLVANNWNVAQYAILIHMLAQVSSLEAGVLLHVIADAHIYDRHIPLVCDLIAREPFPAPRLWINPERRCFYDFAVEDFRVEGYRHHEQIRNIPVAV
ncbi:MAG: thymidylate synthase [Peptococcaceae bacterium]|nr:thymidylate synthase [Peptococcaceae bacterium]